MVGDLVTVSGPMVRREEDSGANVLWWVASSALHGRLVTTTAFSYREVDDQLDVDACPV
jgi:hypothetical protein